jgi:hypothetical protein
MNPIYITGSKEQVSVAVSVVTITVVLTSGKLRTCRHYVLNILIIICIIRKECLVICHEMNGQFSAEETPSSDKTEV